MATPARRPPKRACVQARAPSSATKDVPTGIKSRRVPARGAAAAAKPSILPFTSEVWFTVAKYLPAQPILLLRLATTSRLFYRVFMSDEVWRRCDVYGMDSDIAEHFLQCVYLSTGEELDFRRRLFDKDLADTDVKFLTRVWQDSHRYDCYTIHTWGALVDHRHTFNPTPYPLKILAETGNIHLIHKRYWKDREVFLVAASRCGAAIEFLPEELQTDKELVLAAVRNDGMALQYACDAMKNDYDVVLAAVRQNGMAVSHMPPGPFAWEEDKELHYVYMEAIRNDLQAARHLHHITRSQPAIHRVIMDVARKEAGLKRKRIAADIETPA